MECREAIILAGGLGTRLREVTGELPKCLAPVNGIPFLHYLVNDLVAQGYQHLIFALGYRADLVEASLRTWRHARLAKGDLPRFSFSTETTLLGTGGAIRQALSFSANSQVLVANGDTLFRANLHAGYLQHQESRTPVTMLLKAMPDAGRYGAVQTDAEGLVVAFSEKQPGSAGLINGGLYWLDKSQLTFEGLPMAFSWERDFLPALVTAGRVKGVSDNGYFIDIGVPEDYARAQTDFLTLFTHAET
jgi:D-glycero-alpha-D-manno-heptose 1-phosphate guanylyltransferase